MYIEGDDVLKKRYMPMWCESLTSFYKNSELQGCKKKKAQNDKRSS